MKTNKISRKLWGRKNGEEIFLFKMENSSGAYVELTNYGATVVSIAVPDRKNRLENVVLGFPALEGYLNDRCYIGATIGRFANRIGGAMFRLAEETFCLEKNDNENSNHGGNAGFHSKIFGFSESDGKLSFTVLSEDGEGGFPGNLRLKVDYAWNDRHELSISYSAIADKKTVANFTNHAYFNLSGKENIFEHNLTLKASKMLETNPDYIPTGRIVPVADRGFCDDKISDRITTSSEGIKGLNLYYIIDKDRQKDCGPVCALWDPLSGRQLEVFTTYPGVQLYTGDFLTGNGPYVHKPFSGLCLECQHYPDAPNHAHFPSTVLEADCQYYEQIVYKFSVK